MRKIKVKPTFLTPLFKENLKNEMEKEMAAHSNILAWKIPGTEEPGGLWSMGLQRVGHDSVIEQY